jgi:hypothetical protein
MDMLPPKAWLLHHWLLRHLLAI